MAYMQPPKVIPAIGGAAASNQTAILVPMTSIISGSYTSTVNLPLSVFWFLPLYVDVEFAATKLGVKVTASPGAGSKVSLAIYASDGAGGMPGSIIATAIDISSAATGLAEGAISVTLMPGWVWVAGQRNSTGTVTVTAAATSGGAVTNRAYIDLTNPTTTTLANYPTFSVTNTYGSFSANPTIAANAPNASIPVIYVR